MQVIKGINVSPGIQTGRAYIFNDDANVFVRRHPIPPGEVESEIERFKKAVGDTISEIRKLHARVSREVGESQAKILESQILFLEDKFLIDKTSERIKREKLNSAFIFSRVIEETAEIFSNMGSHYLKGRVEDIRYIGKSVLRNLSGIKNVPMADIKEEVIIVARDLSPADTAMMDKDNIIAFVTDMGSRTSHTAIMARSIGIPAVVGLKDITANVKNGDILIVDGIDGAVIINPDDEAVESYRRKKTTYLETEKELGEFSRLPAQTLDGHHIKLMANIETPVEMGSVISHGADGVGLYRTEFLYLNRKDMPDEQEQYESYKTVISAAAPKRVVIRTVDLGGDKFVSELDMPGEVNPFLGWRGIRFCLEQPDIFIVQLKAILRAAAEGKAAIMFPLVSCMEELQQAKEYLEQAKAELKKQGLAFDENLETGVMIETPAAAVIADILAGEVDFFSIGTNDLIQYSMAVDRVNEKVAHLYRPAHPGILRLIKSVIDAAHSKEVRVDMCGEMAGDSLFVLVLLGMGIDGLSMSPVAVPAAKKLIRSTTYEYAKSLAERALGMSTSAEVEHIIKNIKLREAPA